MSNKVEGSKSILVIEDEQSIRDFCIRVLSTNGFEVDTATTGKEGQRMAEIKLYDMYLVDVRMPGMNGIEFYEWAEETYPHIINKIMFTTGSYMDGHSVASVFKTGRPLLAKPFSTEELLMKVAEFFKEE